MQWKRRYFWIGAAAFVGLLLVAALGTVYLLQTSWFQNQLRTQLVREVERATGGTVEIGSFHYNSHTLTAEVGGFTLHGTEPAVASPLFRADLVEVQLKIISLVKRRAEVESVRVEQPMLNLLIRPDGSTNIPSPKVKMRTGKQIPEQLVDLKIKHFEWNHGVVQTNIERLPINIHGDDVTALLTYDVSAQSYSFKLTSHQLHVASNITVPTAGDLAVEGQLEKDRLVLDQVRYTLPAGNIEGGLVLTHFAHPILDAKIKGAMQAGELAKITRFSQLRSGDVRLEGVAHYDASTPLYFGGRVKGDKLVYQSGSFSLHGFSVTSEVRADRQGVKLAHFSASALGSSIKGDGAIEAYRVLTASGQVEGLSTASAFKLFSSRTLPWSGTAAGTFHVQGTLSGNLNWTLETTASIAPAPEAIPVSGNLQLTYKQNENTLEFQTANFQFPHSALTAAGVLGKSLKVTLDSTDLKDLLPAIALVDPARASAPLLVGFDSGHGHFEGIVSGLLQSPYVTGDLVLTRFQVQGGLWDSLRSHIIAAPSGIDFSSAFFDSPLLHASGSGHIGLAQWRIDEGGVLLLRTQFRGADLAALSHRYSTVTLPIVRGIASGSMDLRGTVSNPLGDARITIDSLDAYGERLNQIQFTAAFSNNAVRVAAGKVQAGPAVLSFSGTYQHKPGTWQDGAADLTIDSNGFPVASISGVRRYRPDLNAQIEIHARGSARLVHWDVEPSAVDGRVALRDVSLNHQRYGSIFASATTVNHAVEAKISGDLESTSFEGTAQVGLTKEFPAKAEFRLAQMKAASIASLLGVSRDKPLPVDGSLQGTVTIDGSLLRWTAMHMMMHLDQLEVTSTLSNLSDGGTPSQFILQNAAPVVIEARDGVAAIDNFQMNGKDTRFGLTGTFPFLGTGPVSLNADGALNLQIFQLLDANVTASGRSNIHASIGGTLREPNVGGTLELQNASFFLAKFPNGLSGVNGTVRFDRNRATIQKLTAHSGGGDLALSGFVSFGGNGPPVYQLGASASEVRVRYAGGVSVTANADVRFTGTSENSLLAGSVTVTKAAFNPSTDVGSLLAPSNAPAAPASGEKGFLQGVQFDIRAESAPNLQLSTSLSQDVEAEIDLHLRGTPEHPAVLGRISVNQGDIKVFGTKYTINRGGVNFFNPAKIEPVLDLDLQTVARGINVDITVSGTLAKLNINYRSDPPLQPRDIIALLAVGRAPGASASVANQQVTNDTSALQSGTNTVLGQAISPVSNRLSRLFGITNIKIDPLVQGITNTPQARLTLEQQISKQITVTYITNLSQTSEQIFRLEWAINRQYSLVALRDDNGEFGVDIQFKRRFK